MIEWVESRLDVSGRCWSDCIPSALPAGWCALGVWALPARWPYQHRMADTLGALYALLVGEGCHMRPSHVAGGLRAPRGPHRIRKLHKKNPKKNMEQKVMLNCKKLIPT